MSEDALSPEAWVPSGILWWFPAGANASAFTGMYVAVVGRLPQRAGQAHREHQTEGNAAAVLEARLTRDIN